MIEYLENKFTALVSWLRDDLDLSHRPTHRFIRDYIYRPLDRLETKYYNFKYGFRNLWDWLPIIWRDRDWDFCHLADINAFKMKRMSEHLAKYGNHVGHDRDARDLAACAELFKRIGGDTNFDELKKRSDFFNTKFYYFDPAKAYPKMVGRIIGRRLYHWWD